MSQQGAHRIHLRVTCARVRAGTIDLFEDNRRFGQADTATAKFFGYQRRKPSCLGQCLHELFRIARRFLDFLPVRAVKRSAYVAHCLADVGVLLHERIDLVQILKLLFSTNHSLHTIESILALDHTINNLIYGWLLTVYSTWHEVTPLTPMSLAKIKLFGDVSPDILLYTLKGPTGKVK